MKVKMEVNDLRYQIFFVIYGEAACKSLAFYLNFKDQTQPAEKCRIAVYVDCGANLSPLFKKYNILSSSFIK